MLAPRRRPVRRRTRRRLFGLATLGLVLLALALRLPFLTARSLWFDEAFSWRLASLLPSAEFFSRAAADVHPILYYLLLWIWLLSARLAPAGAGGPAFSDPEGVLFWMRLLSALLGAATVAAMIMSARVLFRSRFAALAAGLLTAVNAFQLQYAWEARMYTLGTALLPLALAALVQALRAPTGRTAWRYALRLGLLLGAFLHTHYYALFSWVAIGAAKLLFFLSRFRFGVVRALAGVNFRAAEVGFWLSALLFLPWLPVFFEQAARVEASYWIPRIHAWSVPNTLARLFWGGVAEVPPFWAVVASLAAVALVLFVLLRGRTIGDVTAVLAFVVPVALAAALSLRPRSVYLDRFFLFASLGLLLVAARALTLVPLNITILRNIVISGSRGGVGLRAVVLLGATLFGLLSIVRFWATLDVPSHPGARGAAAFLREQASAGEPVVASSPFVYFPLSFHLRCDARGTCPRTGPLLRLYSETGAFLHFAGAPILYPTDLVGPEILDSRLQTPDSSLQRRLWLVDTTGFGGSRLAVPEPWDLVREERFPELFAYQGDIIVREYLRK